MRRRWTYIGLWPNVFFDIYPEWLDFFQVLPAGAGRTRIRARSYGFADDRRETRAARYLCTRLNARVQREDEELTRSVQQGLASGAYTQGILSDKEVVLAGFQDWLRDKLGSGVVVLGAVLNDKPQLLAVVTPDLVKQGYHAGNLIKALAQVVGGGGGGRPDMAQAGGRDTAKLGEALAGVGALLADQAGKP